MRLLTSILRHSREEYYKKLSKKVESGSMSPSEVYAFTRLYLETKAEKRIIGERNDLCKYIAMLTPYVKEFSENEVEYLLFNHLKVIGGELVRRQFPLPSGRIDILYGDVGIEIKLAKSKADIDRVIGQALNYYRSLPHVIVVIFYPKEFPIEKHLASLRILSQEGICVVTSPVFEFE